MRLDLLFKLSRDLLVGQARIFEPTIANVLVEWTPTVDVIFNQLLADDGGHDEVEERVALICGQRLPLLEPRGSLFRIQALPPLTQLGLAAPPVAERVVVRDICPAPLLVALVLQLTERLLQPAHGALEALALQVTKLHDALGTHRNFCERHDGRTEQGLRVDARAPCTCTNR